MIGPRGAEELLQVPTIESDLEGGDGGLSVGCLNLRLWVVIDFGNNKG